MKIKLLKDKHFKFGISLDKGYVFQIFKETDGLWQIQVPSLGDNVWLEVGRKDFELIP